MANASNDNVEFIPLEDAAAMTTGTRITMIPGMQAIYAEALKNILYVKKVPVIRALHPMLGINKETGEDRQAKLYELTSQTSLPTMFHNDERPRNVWTEQLALAEAIGTPDSPNLVPHDFAERVDMFGLCAIILAEDGLVWNMRILSDGPLGRKYGYSEEASKTRRAKWVRSSSSLTSGWRRRKPKAQNISLATASARWIFIGRPSAPSLCLPGRKS